VRISRKKLSRFYYPFFAILGAVFIAVVLSCYAGLLSSYITINYDWSFEFLMVWGQILFQFFLIGKRTLTEKVRYSYRLIGVSLMGALMLLPVLYIHQIRTVSGFAALCYFFCVVTVMFFCHQKIVRRLCLPAHLCYSWVLYRVLILIFIIKYP